MTSPLLQTGFRPMFLAAGAFAALAVPLWVTMWTGELRLLPTLPGPVWHAHEMLLGFTGAVIAGFLLTAVRSWTGRPTLSGLPLALLAITWIAGRLLALTTSPAWVSALVDAAFYLGLAVGVGRPIVAARSWRNAGFVVAALALGAVDVAVHLSTPHALGMLRVALDVIVAIMLVITARVVPMFTANTLPGTTVVRRPTWNKAALGGAIAVLVGELVGLDALVVLGGIVGGVAVAVRAAGWAPLAALRVPLLAILHVGHAWVGVGLLLRAATAAGLSVPPSAATHALTVGGIGCLTLGMMARVALGHTGRPLVASRVATVAFALVAAAAVIRVTAAVWPSTPLLATAGGVFGLAFGAWTLHAVPSLMSPRVDGRPG